MQTYKGLFFFKSTFFAEGRPDGVRKYGKMRPKYGNIRPVWTRPDPKDFLKSAPFFYASVRPSVKAISAVRWHQKIKATDVLKPMYLLQKCRDVHIFAPAAYFKKQANILYCDRNCGSKVVQTSSFSHAPGSDCCVRVADPTSNRKNTKRSHDSA